MMDLREAYAWAEQGNIAVHDSGFTYRGRRAYHLLCQPLERLHAAAERIGVKRCWYQGSRVPRHRHYDIFGAPLERALALCRKQQPDLFDTTGT